jgi:hypothetical protein
VKIFLRLTLDCSIDSAWAALADPKIFAAVSAPLMRFKSLEPGGFPEKWTAQGPHLVAIKLFGVMPMGKQTIDTTFTQRPGGVKMMIDSGSPQAGMLTVIKDWDHRMAVSASSNSTTLYRDRLKIKAGVLTPFVFLPLWVFWQYRGIKLRRLAKKWN